MLLCLSRSVGGWLKDSLKGWIASCWNKLWTFAQGKGYLFGRKLFQCALCFDSIDGGITVGIGRNSDDEHLRRLAFGIFSLSNLKNLWDALASVGRPGNWKSPISPFTNILTTELLIFLFTIENVESSEV